jgi:IS30 family transposase
MPYRHFTSDDRDRLQQLQAQQVPLVEAAEELGKHPSSLKRELMRNGGPLGYISGKAEAKARDRRFKTKPCPKKERCFVMDEVESRIKQNHAPEQIAGRLKLDFPQEPIRWVSTETIYTWLYAKIRAGAELKHHLRHGRKTRRKRLSGREKRVIIKDKVSIDHRPADVQSKQQCGHWEGDTVEGARKLGYLGTYTERKTKFLVCFSLKSKQADTLAKATAKAFKTTPAGMLKTITYDNGTEFARHKDVARDLGVKIYFAHPYHSWERGLNEHTNGLLRQYFPKGAFLTDFTAQQVAKAVKQINNRPRKCLDYQTPAEAYSRELCALQI